MSEENSVRVGDVSDTGNGFNVKDLLHISDVARGDASVTANENLYDITGDSIISQEDTNAMYDILRGDRNPPESTNSVLFRWVYNETVGDYFLQVKNTLLQLDENSIDTGLVSESGYSNLFYFYESTFNENDGTTNTQINDAVRPKVANNYPFTKQIIIDENTTAEFKEVSGSFRLYINGFPTFFNLIETEDNGTGLKLDDSNPPVETNFTQDQDQTHYPIFQKSMTPFITVWDVADEQKEIVIPLSTDGLSAQNHSNSISIDYGDGSPSEFIYYETGGTISHTYEESGSYEVKINGNLETWSFDNQGSINNLKEIKQWGCLNLTNSTNEFFGCSQLKVTANDSPILKEGATLSNCFSSCINLDDKGFENWDVSNVVNFDKMFDGCTSFNCDISRWNTSSATSMEFMFRNNTNFNININTNKSGDTIFWDVANLINAKGTLAGCTSFDQSLYSWNISKIQNMESFLNDVSLSMCNYVKMLRSWSLLSFQNTNISFSAPSCQYDFSTASYRNSLNSFLNIDDGGIDTENNCAEGLKYATLLFPTQDHINSGIDLMDSRLWQSVWHDSDDQFKYEALLLPFYDIDFYLRDALYDAENDRLVNSLNTSENAYIMFDVFFDEGIYNYEHNWYVGEGSVAILTAESDTEIQSSYPSATLVDSLTSINFDDTLTRVILNLRNYYVGTVEDYITNNRSLPTKLPNVGEHLYVYRKNETGNSIVKSETIRIDSFDSPSTFANFAMRTGIIPDVMYVDNGASGMLVYYAHRGDTPNDTSKQLQYQVKTNNKWSDAVPFLNKFAEVTQEQGVDEIGQPIVTNGALVQVSAAGASKIIFCPHINKLLLMGQTRYIWFDYNKNSNTLEFNNQGTFLSDDLKGWNSTIIGVTPEQHLLFDRGDSGIGIRLYTNDNSEFGYSQLQYLNLIGVDNSYLQNDFEICSDERRITYNPKTNKIEIVYFTSVDAEPFSGNLVCQKDIWELTSNIELSLVKTKSMSIKVVNDIGESLYPNFLPNTGDQPNLAPVHCISVRGSSDDKHSVYYPVELYWEQGIGRIPMFYHNTETDHFQSFEISCDALIFCKVSHDMLITIEYDDSPNNTNDFNTTMSTVHNYTFLRFTEIDSSDPENIKFNQIFRKNIAEVGFQIPIQYEWVEENDPTDRRINYMHDYLESYNWSDWLSVQTNSNSEIFSVLVS